MISYRLKVKYGADHNEELEIYILDNIKSYLAALSDLLC